MDGNLWAPGTDVPAGWDSPGSRGDLVSLLDWVWGQAMRGGGAFAGGAEACLYGYLLALRSREPDHPPVLVSSGRLARRGEVRRVTR